MVRAIFVSEIYLWGIQPAKSRSLSTCKAMTESIKARNSRNTTVNNIAGYLDRNASSLVSFASLYLT